MIALRRRLGRSEDGMAATEYALLAAALVVSLYVASTALREVQAQSYKNQQKALLDWRSP